MSGWSRVHCPLVELGNLPFYPATVLKLNARRSAASALMTNGGFALNGLEEYRAQQMWRLLITIRHRNVYCYSPGAHLAEEPKELDMSAAELARQLDVPSNRVMEILNGNSETRDSLP
jgi:hypothetical protein